MIDDPGWVHELLEICLGLYHRVSRHIKTMLRVFERLCASPLVRAIDLGNSEEYDLGWLLERCAESDTVLYSRIAAEPGEGWRSYVERLARLVTETGARCILRPMVHPDSREECTAMRDIWHERT